MSDSVSAPHWMRLLQLDGLRAASPRSTARPMRLTPIVTASQSCNPSVMSSADGDSGAPPQRKYVFVVRHGERIDSVDEGWRSRASRPHDPPLSPAGVKQAYAAGRLIHQRVVAERGVDSAADIGIYSSPFLRCVQSAKALSTGYYDQLQGRQKVDFDVQIKIEHGLAEFLTPLNFSSQLQPLSLAEFNRVLEGELDKFYVSSSAAQQQQQRSTDSPHEVRSPPPLPLCLCCLQTPCHPFPVFPESVSALYRRLQSTLLSLLSSSPHCALVLITHGYGLQLLSEYASPDTLVTRTDVAAVTELICSRGGAAHESEAEAGHWGRVPKHLPHSRLVPEPLPSQGWSFRVGLFCTVQHWKDEEKATAAQGEAEAGMTLANPLPAPEQEQSQ